MADLGGKKGIAVPSVRPIREVLVALRERIEQLDLLPLAPSAESESRDDLAECVRSSGTGSHSSSKSSALATAKIEAS